MRTTVGLVLLGLVVALSACAHGEQTQATRTATAQTTTRPSAGRPDFDDGYRAGYQDAIAAAAAAHEAEATAQAAAPQTGRIATSQGATTAQGTVRLAGAIQPADPEVRCVPVSPAQGPSRY